MDRLPEELIMLILSHIHAEILLPCIYVRKLSRPAIVLIRHCNKQINAGHFAISGRREMISWAINSKLCFDLETLCENAAAYGHVHLLRQFMPADCRLAMRAVNSAVIHGQIAVVKYLTRDDRTLPQTFLYTAVEYGQVAMLEYLQTRVDIFMRLSLLRHAVSVGSVRAFEWLLPLGEFPGVYEKIKLWARERSTPEMLSYLSLRGYIG